MGKRFGFADVKPLVIAVGMITVDEVMAAHVDVERDDGEFVLTIFPVESFQFREDARRDDVQSAKCQFSQVASTQFLGVGFYFARRLVGPATQAVVLVKQEVALRLAFLDQNCCQGVVLDVVYFRF